MNSERIRWLRSFIAPALTVMALAVLTPGCSTIPGMQMGVQVSDDSNGEGLPPFDSFPITAATIRGLLDINAAAGVVSPTSHSENATYRYLIGPQDILRVTVWDHPELNNPGAVTGAGSSLPAGIGSTSTTILGTPSADSSSRLVGDDGTMFYPYVGVISVAGKSPDEVRSYLAKRLSTTIRDPQVEVVVASFRSKRAFIAGEVKNPGVLPVTDIPLRVTDAISAAGGLNTDADLVDATLTRGTSVIPLDLYALFYKGDLSQNLAIESNDILNVPEQRFSKVFVLGEVVKPASLLMPRGPYTLNEALSDAGGAIQSTAKASQIYVIRRLQPTGRIAVFQLNATRPDALILGDEFLLRPRDIVFVDAAEIVRFNRIISQVLPTLQALQAGKYLGQ